jgi:hypothetical protein
MILKKDEVKNLIGMLKSPDKDNRLVAFKIIEDLDLKKHVGEIMVMYKYGEYNLESWEADCKPAHEFIVKRIEKFNGDWENKLSSGEILSLMTANKSSKQSIELFLEYFIEDLTKMIGAMGYPTDKFELYIKLKEDGQTKES